MGNLSTYRASGLPVGSVTMMHKQTQQSLIVDNGAEFLRTGEYVPYDAKYDKAVALGFYSTSGGTIYNPTSNYCAPVGYNSAGVMYANKTLMYAKGKLGYLTSTENLMAQGAGQEYYFTGIGNNSELDRPIVVKAPSYEAINLPKPLARSTNTISTQTYYRTVSQPTWYSAGSCWISVVMAGTSIGSISATLYYDLHLFTSKDGISWVSGGMFHTIETSAVTSWVNHVAAAAVGNVLNVCYGASTTVYNIFGLSYELDALSNVAGSLRAPATITSHADATGSDDFSVSIAPLSPNTGYFAYSTHGSNSTGEFKLFDTVTTDAWATTAAAGSLTVSTAYVAVSTPPFLMASNGTSLVTYSNASPNPEILRVADVNNVRSFQVTQTTQAATPSFGPSLYWSGNFYVLVTNDATTSTSGTIRKITGDTNTVTTLTNLLPADTAGAVWMSARVEGSQYFKNHVIYHINNTWAVGNLTTNVTSDFSPHAVTGGIKTASEALNSVIMADTTNLLLARGSDGTNNLATISKYDLTNPNVAPDLKYVATAVTGPVHSNGEFKRLTDPGTTLVYIPRATGINTFLYSTNNGDTWTLSATFAGINGINDIEYIGGRYVVAGNAVSSLNYAHATSLGGAWTTGFINSTTTNVLRLHSTGTALIAFGSAGMQQRSTTGTAWTACSGTQINTQTSYVKNGTTSYVFTAGATYRVSRHQSTDDGVTWSAATTLSMIVPSAYIPNRFVAYGSKWYCILSVPTTNLTNGDVYETTDFTTFTEVPRTFPIETSGRVMSGPFVYGTAVYSINTGRDVLLNANATFYPFNGYVISRLGGGTASFVGCSEGVVGNNMVGYLRIK